MLNTDNFSGSLSISSFSVAICLRSTCSRAISSSCSVRSSFSCTHTHTHTHTHTPTQHGQSLLQPMLRRRECRILGRGSGRIGVPRLNSFLLTSAFGSPVKPFFTEH